MNLLRLEEVFLKFFKKSNLTQSEKMNLYRKYFFNNQMQKKVVTLPLRANSSVQTDDKKYEDREIQTSFKKLEKRATQTDLPLKMDSLMQTDDKIFQDREIQTKIKKMEKRRTQTELPINSQKSQTELENQSIGIQAEADISSVGNQTDRKEFAPLWNKRDVRESTPRSYESFQDNIATLEDQNSVSAPSHQQFYPENIYENVPLNAETLSAENSEMMDLSEEKESFLNNLRKETENSKVDMRDFSVKNLSDDEKSYAIVRNLRTNEVMTVDKPKTLKKKRRKSLSDGEPSTSQGRKSFSPLKTRRQREGADRPIQEGKWWIAYEHKRIRDSNKRK